MRSTLQLFEAILEAQGHNVVTEAQRPTTQWVTVLFSDLQGSTVWYEIIGDAAAYRHVQRHFILIRACVSAFQGHLVKTLGDGVMAIFHHPEDAIRAAVAIQKRTVAFNHLWDIDPPLNVKIGLHYGAAIAHHTPGQVDYFGRTVNMAAHVKEESLGGDVVLTADLLQQTSVTRLCLEDYVLTPFTAWLKGVEESIQLYRLTLPAAAAMRDIEVLP